jgi:hypothetical protein
MNVGQVSKHRKFRWCGAANPNMHGSRKKRLTLQHGWQKQPPSTTRLVPDPSKGWFIAVLSQSQQDSFTPIKMAVSSVDARWTGPNLGSGGPWLAGASISACVTRMRIELK